MSGFTVTELLVYPIKSMRGISLKNATLTRKGLDNDRRWMVVDADDRFVTQKDIPQLALINTSLVDDGIQLSMQGEGEIHVPFSLHRGDSIETMVWGSRCETFDQGQEISHWLTGALGNDRPLRLVRMHPDYQRPTKKADIIGRSTTIDFADIAPYLVTNMASLDRLNSELATAGYSHVQMDRFRPNIVVRGPEPFVEHQLPGLQSTKYALKMRLHCERCVVTTIDQKTAGKDPNQQPFRILRDINPMPNKKAGPAFGHYATLLMGHGKNISVGDLLQPLV